MKALAVFFLGKAFLARLAETLFAHQSIFHRVRDAIAEIVVACEAAAGLSIVSRAI